MLAIVLLLVGALCASVYLFLIWNFGHWRGRGVHGPKPKLLVGTFPSLLNQKQNFANDMDAIYRQYKDTQSVVGVYFMRVPQLLVLDPSLIREVYVTAFKHFQANEISNLVDQDKDPLIARNPFLLNGEAWKKHRALVTPGLTSTRVKVQYIIMQKVCRSLCEFLEKEDKMSPADGVDAKGVALRFTAENVSDSVLGIEARSFTENPIPVGATIRKFMEDNTIFMIYSITAGLFPMITKFYRPKFLPKGCDDFYKNLLDEAFKMRERTKVDRLDFMNHLLMLKEKNMISKQDMYSYSMIFLFDGLDTTASVISHTLLLLALDANRQELLHREIVEHLDKEGELSFEDVCDLPYLDACVNESLRLLPPGLWSSKTCTEPYEFTGKNGSKIHVRTGDVVLLPIYSLHRDPSYFEEPDEFRPERFLPENGGVKKYREQGVFLPFGEGPRMCIGMRFALVQTKAAVSAIVRDFHIKANRRVKTPIRLDPKSLIAMPDGGVWLDFKKRVGGRRA